jgi:hypothetical protein
MISAATETFAVRLLTAKVELGSSRRRFARHGQLRSSKQSLLDGGARCRRRQLRRFELVFDARAATMVGLFFVGLVMRLWEEGRFPGAGSSS